ncbi:MAG: sugar ABC transporter permease YjfF [Planctomycetes bacterium]|nr:sugar ABC transporter permease YjfF [Planctomycetota bacterium]
MKVARFLAERPLALTLVVFGLFAAFAGARYDGILSWRVLANLIEDDAELGLAALGATFVLIGGGLDLSIGAVCACSGVLVATLVTGHGVEPALAFGCVTAVGAAFGAFQGWVIERAALPPFLVTLAGLFLARSAALALAPESIAVDHPTLAALGDARLELGDFSFGVLGGAWLLATLGGAWLLALSRFGRAVRAVGGNPRAAANFGLRPARVRIALYALSAGCAALAGAAHVVYGGSASAIAANGMELDAIAAAVIGGTALSGGVGSAFGTALGVLLFGFIQTVILFEGTLGAGWTRIAVGALFLGFVAARRLIERWARAT